MTSEQKIIQKKLIRLVLTEIIPFSDYIKLLKQLRECTNLDEFEKTQRLRYEEYDAD